MKIAKYFFTSLILSLAMIAVAIGVTVFGFHGASPIWAGAGVLVSFISGLIAFVITFRGLKKPHVKFFGALVGGMGLKILIGLVAVSAVALLVRPHIYEFVIAFFISYLVLTAFEVYSLNRNLRPENSGSIETTSPIVSTSTETTQETVSNDK